MFFIFKYDLSVTFPINIHHGSIQGKVVLSHLGYLHISTLVLNLFCSQFFSHGTLNTLSSHILFLSIKF